VPIEHARTCSSTDRERIPFLDLAAQHAPIHRLKGSALAGHKATLTAYDIESGQDIRALKRSDYEVSLFSSLWTAAPPAPDFSIVSRWTALLSKVPGIFSTEAAFRFRS
jgi:hypothetical protein